MAEELLPLIDTDHDTVKGKRKGISSALIGDNDVSAPAPVSRTPS